MVIVHLSANQRRIISPEKNETLDQLFKRFCLEFGYVESEYEFQSYPEDHRVLLDVNINANRVKEVSLAQKLGSRRASEDSCYAVIHDASPKIIEKRKKIVAPVPPSVILPALSSVLQSPVEITAQIKTPKRSAPKPPLIVDKNIDDVNESIIPDIEIPPPPGFMPGEKESSNELLYKSVECETRKDSMTISTHSSSNDSVRQTPDSLINVLEIYNSLDNTEESEDSNANIANDIDKVDSSTNMAYLIINDEVNESENESNTDSSVEDVYEDENLFGNYKKNDKPGTKDQILDNISDEDDENCNQSNNDFPYRDESPANDLINNVHCQSSDSEKEIVIEKEKVSEDIEKLQLNDRNSDEWKDPDSISVNDIVHTVCPAAKIEENDIIDRRSSTNEDISINNSSIDGVIIGDNEYRSEQNQKHEDPSSIYANSNKISGKISPNIEENAEEFAENAEKNLQRFTDLELGSDESAGSLNTKSQQLPETSVRTDSTDDISFTDGHSTNLPLEITSGVENPKYFWGQPKQGKTMQFLSRKLNTIDIPEDKPVNKDDKPEIPIVTLRSAKEVQVIVQEIPTEQYDRPTYRPRQGKSLYFTASKK